MASSYLTIKIMKALIISFVSIFLTWILSISSCKKENDNNRNRPPISRAGEDLTITLPSCSELGSVELDGSASFDPDNNIVLYRWYQLVGYPSLVLKNANSPRATVENVFAGTFPFVLKVTDAAGKASTDIVVIHASGPAKEYELDISYSGYYIYSDNAEECDYYQCTYYDKTSILGVIDYPHIGQLVFSLSEHTDSAAASLSHNTYVRLHKNNFNNFSIGGSLSVNFKNLIQRGGGRFTGVLSIDIGSAQVCDPNVFKNVLPLTVSGNLNVAAKTIDMRIVGKIYF
jgi:hypothetical protein